MTVLVWFVLHNINGYTATTRETLRMKPLNSAAIFLKTSQTATRPNQKTNPFLAVLIPNLLFWFHFQLHREPGRPRDVGCDATHTQAAGGGVRGLGLRGGAGSRQPAVLRLVRLCQLLNVAVELLRHLGRGSRRAAPSHRACVFLPSAWGWVGTHLFALGPFPGDLDLLESIHMLAALFKGFIPRASLLQCIH